MGKDDNLMNTLPEPENQAEGLDRDEIKKTAAKANRRFITIPGMDAYRELLQGFTTRFGGVSEGPFASLNLNFNRPDPKENVAENYRLLGQSLGVASENMVLSRQVHGNRVEAVDKSYGGMGILRPRSYEEADGLITGEKGLLLITLYADCVPLYFYDPRLGVIGLAHSGWKGTLLNIGAVTVEALQTHFGSKPGDIRVFFGPHIRSCCFEVGEDVAEQFFNTFASARKTAAKNAGGKWMLNLEAVITQALEDVGLLTEHITGGQKCTRCLSESFFSHRGSGGNTGTGAAFMMLKN